MLKLENDTLEDQKALKEALDYVSGDPTAKKIIEGMEQKGVKIHMIHDPARDGNDRYDQGSNTIYWNPKASLDVEDSNQKTVGVRSAAILLMHEGAHATDPNFLKNLNTTNAQYDNDADAIAIGKEDEIAKDRGEPIRLNHRGSWVSEADPTEHTHANPDGTANWVEKGGVKSSPYAPGTTPIVAPSAVLQKAQATSDGWRSFDSGSDSPVGQIGQEMDAARAFVEKLQQKNQGAEQAVEREPDNGNPVTTAIAPALNPTVTRGMLLRSWQNEGRG